MVTTKHYTPWFDASALNQSRTSMSDNSDAPSPETGSFAGLVYASQPLSASKPPPSNEESVDETYTITIPPYPTDDSTGETPQGANMALGFISHRVEDWGTATLDGNVIIDMSESAEKPGVYNGHAEWSRWAFPLLSEGEHRLNMKAWNIFMQNPDENKFVCEGNILVLALESGGIPTICESECSCKQECAEACSTAGGQGDSASGRARSLSLSSSTALSASYTTSSAGSRVTANTDEYRMVWGINMGILRGLGAALDGSLQLAAEELSPELASPAALQFKHPLSTYLRIPEEGLVEGCRLELVNGVQVMALRYYQDGSIAPIGIDTAGGGMASMSELDGAPVFQWVDKSGNKSQYSATTGQLLRYISADSSVMENVADYLVINRHAETNSIEQIWSRWDGLLNIETIDSDNNSYTIALYTTSQIAGQDENGRYTLIDEASPFKSFTIQYSLVEDEAQLIITEQMGSHPDFVRSWSQGADGAWTMTKGTGADAITSRKTRSELEAGSNGLYGIWQVVTELSKNGELATRRADVYQTTPVGHLLLSSTEGYGSELAQTSLYSYDGAGHQTKVEYPNGHVVENNHDRMGRLIYSRQAWGAGDHIKVQRYDYANSDADTFNQDLAQVVTEMITPDDLRVSLLRQVYSYSIENNIKRTEIRSYSDTSQEAQLTVKETWQGDAANSYAQGRTRMSQAVNGVQTWYDYAATSQHGALYTVTQESRVDGELVAGQSTRSVAYITEQGNTTREEQYALLSDGNWALISGQSHSYDVQNRLVGTSHDNGRSSSRALVCTGQTLWEIDENGIRTDYAYDTARTLVEKSRSETPTMPETITEWTKDAAGRTLTTKQFIGAMESETRTTYDALGRTISQTDALGRTTTTAYSEDGLTSTTTTRSGHLAKLALKQSKI